MSNKQQFGVTTIDNPYDYFTQFRQWYLYDVEKGYNTCERLSKLAKLSQDMTQKEEIEAAEKAIDKLIELDFLQIYRKVVKDT